MQIYILDSDKNKLRYAELYFSNEPDVLCVHSDFSDFVKSTQVDCIVSPANSFGLMDGGYDRAITEYFGDELQKEVQRYIMNNYWGEQPIASSFIIDIPNHDSKLIHTPTMRSPEQILDSKIIYHCTRSTLICALQNRMNSLLVPMFGGGCGNIHPKRIAEMMWRAYKQIKTHPSIKDWNNVEEII